MERDSDNKNFDETMATSYKPVAQTSTSWFGKATKTAANASTQNSINNQLRNSDTRANGGPTIHSNVQETVSSEPQVKASCDIYRLARFGANISDAHSCFIFLPAELLAQLTCSPLMAQSESGRSLILAGFHSLSSEVIRDCRVPRENGLIGWVSKHNRSIHVSPFEQDSRSLGIYSNDQELKSFIGIPIALESRDGRSAPAGVIACDSKKSFAFSKLQGKLLENLAREISNTIQLLLLTNAQGQADVAWQTFLRRAEELSSALGNHSVEVVRLKTSNFEQLESTLGTSECLALSEQVFRLIQQTLPPHYPTTRLVNGDIIVCVDAMMSSFYENKIRAVCEHIAIAGRRPQFEFLRASARDRKLKSATIETLVTLTSQNATSPSQKQQSSGAQQGGLVVRLEKEIANEYRRA